MGQQKNVNASFESHRQLLREKGLTPFFHRAGLFFCLLLHEREHKSSCAITAALLLDRGGPHFSLALGPDDWVLVIIADHRAPSPSDWTLRDPERAVADFYPQDQILSILEALRTAGEAFREGGEAAIQIVVGGPL